MSLFFFFFCIIHWKKRYWYQQVSQCFGLFSCLLWGGGGRGGGGKMGNITLIMPISTRKDMIIRADVYV